MAKETIYLVDDEPAMLENGERILSREGYHCRSFDNGRAALQAMAEEAPALILTDLRMPELDGLELLKCVRASGIPAPVVMVTAFATIETAVAAIKDGAFDYLTKPFSNDQLRLVVERALRERRLLEENQRLRSQLEKSYGLDRIIGYSQSMQAVFQVIRKAAPTEANVLIQGESGTGKELVARALHMNSRRSSGPFVPVDCASLPENLLEAELFGHEKGAFTDAHQSKAGLVESADGGTLFLDEIGDMSLTLQAKLLRVIQERQIRRLGSNRFTPVSVRVVSATHRPLEALVGEKKFREDLFYRLNVIGINLPPLRQRNGDLMVLAKHFLKKFSQTNGRKIEGFDPAALRLLAAYPWPGNVRQLQNVIERAVTLSEGALITPEDLPESLRNGAAGRTPFPAAPAFQGLSYEDAKRRVLDGFEEQYWKDLLNRHGGNVTAAADEAGGDRKTIHRFLSKDRMKERQAVPEDR